MHLEIAVVAVGLAGQQAFDLHRLGLRADRLRSFSASTTIAWSPSASPSPISISASSRPCDSARSEQHTSELQSLMRISYAVLCLKKKNKHIQEEQQTTIVTIR